MVMLYGMQVHLRHAVGLCLVQAVAQCGHNGPCMAKTFMLWKHGPSQGLQLQTHDASIPMKGFAWCSMKLPTGAGSVWKSRLSIHTLWSSCAHQRRVVTTGGFHCQEGTEVSWHAPRLVHTSVPGR